MAALKTDRDQDSIKATTENEGGSDSAHRAAVPFKDICLLGMLAG